MIRKLSSAAFLTLLIALVAASGYRKYIGISANRYFGENTLSFRDRLDRQAPRLEADIQTLKAFPAFATHRADAGSKLNAWVSWAPAPMATSAPGARKQGWTAQAKNPARLVALWSKFQGWADKWIEHLPEYSLEGLDFRWMSELAAFDSWDIEIAPELKSATEREPDARELEAWGQARLVKCIQDGDLPVAGPQVAQLASLMIATEQPQLARAALSLFKKLNDTSDYFLARVGSRAYSPTVTPALLAAYTRVLDASGAFLSGATPGDLIQAAYAQQATRNPTACIALNERIGALRRDRGLIGQVLLDGIPEIDHLLEDGLPQCRIRRTRALWAGKQVPIALRADQLALPAGLPDWPGLDLLVQGSRMLFTKVHSITPESRSPLLIASKPLGRAIAAAHWKKEFDAALAAYEARK